MPTRLSANRPDQLGRPGAAALPPVTKLRGSWWSGAESNMAGPPRKARKQRFPRTRRELPGDPVSRGVGPIARQFVGRGRIRRHSDVNPQGSYFALTAKARTTIQVFRG